MQAIKMLFLPLALLGTMSFTGNPTTNDPILETKTYGICGSKGEVSNAPKVELTLRPDFTFHYINASDPSHPVDAKGVWVMQGKKVVLQADGAQNGFHKTWKLDTKTSCITSRKGLNFIRLCDLD